MTENTIIGKVFDGRTIDRVDEIENGLIEIGFTDNSFERVHQNDYSDFCNVLGVAVETKKEVAVEAEVVVEDTVVLTQEILDENPVLAEAGVQVGDIGYATDEVPEGVMIEETLTDEVTEEVE